MRTTGLLLSVWVLALTVAGCRDEAPGDTPPDAAVAVCGDGVAEGDEACDGADLRGQTCASLGLGAGDGLVCGADCQLDGSACAAQGCGDGFCDPDGGEGQLPCPVDCAWTALAAVERNSCGVRVDGSVWCWGKNHAGQLGADPGVASAVPRRVVGVPPATHLALGSGHACALTATGSVWCWGANLRGQLGVGYGDTGPLPPTPVSGLTNVVSLAAGASHSCAVTDAHDAYCWGDNSMGQLGTETPTNRWLPAVVDGLEPVGTVAIGGVDECPFTCATTLEAVALCWGCNARGGLGRGADLTPESDWHPEPVLAQSSTCDSLALVRAGGGHACGVTPADELCCWGANDVGQVGLGSTDALQPTAEVLEYPLGTAATWTAFGVGGRHGCAVQSGGSLLCWGGNHFGQLGSDGEEVRYLPGVVPGFDGALTVSGGVEHSCVLAADGLVWCFGQNFFGQLGDGTTIDRVAPGPVAF